MNIKSTNFLHTLLISGWALKSRQIYEKEGKGKGFGDTVRKLLKDMYIAEVDNLSNRLNGEEMLEVLQKSKDNGIIPYDETLPEAKQITSWISRNTRKVESENTSQKQSILEDMKDNLDISLSYDPFDGETYT